MRGEIYISDAAKERFFTKFNVSESGCWEWASTNNEYGNFYVRIGERMQSTGAHRASYIIHYGQIPEGLCVCHTCDNPSCVNPVHLFLGTRSQNSRDMVNKGRNVIPSDETSIYVKIRTSTLENMRTMDKVNIGRDKRSQWYYSIDKVSNKSKKFSFIRDRQSGDRFIWRLK